MAASIEFKLWAPYNKVATLVGSFSNWEEIPMKKGKDGFFLTSVKLEDGVYQYKFKVQSRSWFFEPDQWVEVNDPYAIDIDDSSQNCNVRIKDGERIVDTYVWKNDDKPLPADDELVIYELHVGDFSGGEDDPYARGKYKHVVEKLDYLADLGINCIELMPVKEYPGDHGWGYNPRYFFATESSYGTTAELKALIDACHGRGIRVLMDGIYNHSESESPLTQIDHDYWYHHDPKDPDNNWGPEFNYEFYDEKFETYPARRFIGDVVRFWIKEYHTDGIRYDAARQLGNYDFMHWIVEETKKTAGMKPFYNVAEYIPQDPAITNADGPMDGAWHENFYNTMIDHLCNEQFDLERLKSALDAKREGYQGATNVVNYLTSHDHNHLMYELGERGILEEAAFKRAKLGSALLMTAIGIPMIWMGEEFAEYKAKSLEQNKIDWTLLGNEKNMSLHDYYKGLIFLRKNNHALYTENIEFFYEQADDRVLAYTRWNDEGSRVVVVANLSGNFLKDYTIPHIPADGIWHEWSSDYDVEISGNTLVIDLPEYEAKVLVL